MTRRQPQQGDSLEMLLDTMCNTFGGIILIALLIALLARENKVSEAERQRVTESSSALEAQIDQAEKELARTKQLQTELEARTADAAQAGALKLIEERERLRQKSALLDELARASADAARTGSAVSQEQVIAQMQAMAATNRDAEQKLIEQRNLGSSLVGRLEQLKRGVQTESNRLAQVTAQQTQQTRPPQEYSTEKKHFYIILRHGRMYPLYFFRGGEPVMNNTSLRWTQQSPTSRLVEPIAGAGFDPVSQEPSVAQFLRELPTDRIYVIFQLYEDSFPAFNTVKSLLARQRLEYTWQGRRNEEPITLGATPDPPPPPQ